VENSSHVPVWRIAADSDVRMRSWEGEHVLYLVNSGDTHLIGAEAAHIMRLLQRGPATQAELTQQIAASSTQEAGIDLRRRVESLLRELGSHGIIEGSRR